MGLKINALKKNITYIKYMNKFKKGTNKILGFFHNLAN